MVDALTETDWFVYILQSSAVPKFYTGISINPTLRLKRHNGILTGGAKFTRTGRPWEIVYVEGPMSHSEALRRERDIKKMSRKAKKALRLPTS